MPRRSVEGALLGALQELGNVLGAERVMNAASSVLQTAAQTKATVDGNVAAVLGLAGLPSRSDIEALRRQLDVVQATLANLSRKLDRLAEEVAHKELSQPTSSRAHAAPSRAHPASSRAHPVASRPRPAPTRRRRPS
jgi:hypothetical protein